MADRVVGVIELFAACNFTAPSYSRRGEGADGVDAAIADAHNRFAGAAVDIKRIVAQNDLLLVHAVETKSHCMRLMGWHLMARDFDRQVSCMGQQRTGGPCSARSCRECSLRGWQPVAFGPVDQSNHYSYQ